MTARVPDHRLSLRQCLALFGWAVLFLSGCAARGQMESLEAEIRQSQDSLYRAEAKSSELQSQLAQARQETELLRSQVASTGNGTSLPEQTGNLVRLSGVKINTLLSGGKDRDGQPGDDILVTLITPIDQQGDLVKIAGEVEIEAYDMTRPGDDKKVGRWTFDSGQSTKAWHSGFVGAGLQFELPWQDLPTAKELVVHARLRTTDGRQFDTNSPLKVVPPQAASPSAPVLLPVPTIQPVKHETTELKDRLIERADLAVPAATRPVPFYDDVETATARPFPALEKLKPVEASPAQQLKPRPAPTKKSKPASTKPKRGHATLDGIETSDNWTDATIPRLR